MSPLEKVDFLVFTQKYNLIISVLQTTKKNAILDFFQVDSIIACFNGSSVSYKHNQKRQPHLIGVAVCIIKMLMCHYDLSSSGEFHYQMEEQEFANGCQNAAVDDSLSKFLNTRYLTKNSKSNVKTSKNANKLIFYSYLCNTLCSKQIYDNR